MESRSCPGPTGRGLYRSLDLKSLRSLNLLNPGRPRPPDPITQTKEHLDAYISLLEEYATPIHTLIRKKSMHKLFFLIRIRNLPSKDNIKWLWDTRRIQCFHTHLEISLG
jgi:hypothetical protein